MKENETANIKVPANGREGAVSRRCHQENSFSFFSSVLIKNLIEINQAIKSGRCNGGGGGGREKGERVSAQSEKDPLIQILTTTPNGTECEREGEKERGEQRAFIIRERSSLHSFLAYSPPLLISRHSTCSLFPPRLDES